MRACEGQDWPDPTRAIQARRDLDDVLRQALHAAVDPVEPAGDGLTRILHQLTTPSPIRQARLLVTDCADLARLIAIWLEPAFTGAMGLLRRQPAGHQGELPYQATGATARFTRPWLRPALAVAGAAALVVVAVVVLGPVRQIVAPTSLNAGPSANAPAHSGVGLTGGGGLGQSPTTNLAQAGPTRSGTTSARAGRASHRPGTTPTPSPAVSPAASTTASPSQSPTPTATPSKSNNGHHSPHPGKSKPPKGG